MYTLSIKSNSLKSNIIKASDVFPGSRNNLRAILKSDRNSSAVSVPLPSGGSSQALKPDHAKERKRAKCQYQYHIPCQQNISKFHFLRRYRLLACTVFLYLNMINRKRTEEAKSLVDRDTAAYLLQSKKVSELRCTI